MSTQNKLVLIDGHALAYRVFFGLPVESFTTKDGEPTNATFGFTRTIFDFIFAENPPAYFAVSFDVGRTFRDDWFEAYKGTREKMPDELSVQIGRIKEVVAALNIPILELEGYEADDVLGTIARQVKPLGVPVHIITGDRDLLQLVDDNTTIELPKGRYDKGPQIYNSVESVIKKMGVRPDQIVDYKALEGDASDNIPGVKGVGKKTAVTLLTEYETLDAVYEHLDDIKPRFSNKLRADKDNAYLSQKLARIVTDAPISLELEDCRSQDFDPGPALALLRKLEFRTLSRLLAEQTQDLSWMGDDARRGRGNSPRATGHRTDHCAHGRRSRRHAGHLPRDQRNRLRSRNDQPRQTQSGNRRHRPLRPLPHLLLHPGRPHRQRRASDQRPDGAIRHRSETGRQPAHPRPSHPQTTADPHRPPHRQNRPQRQIRLLRFPQLRRSRLPHHLRHHDWGMAHRSR